jgi:hypothetical protein
MGFLKKARALSMIDYFVLIWASIVLPVTGLRLRRQGFNQTNSWACKHPARKPAENTDSIKRSADLARIVNFVAARGLYRANCLCRSLVLLKAMHREGLPGELKIGVPKDGNDRSPALLNAHAWVECDGIIINDHKNVADQHAAFDLD